MKLTLDIEQESDGRWVAEIPDLPGALAYGLSREEAVSRAGRLAQHILADRTLHSLVWVDPDRMCGEACFAGTRVPVLHLFEHLEQGDTIEDFLQGFPGVTRQQVVEVLKASAGALLKKVPE